MAQLERNFDFQFSTSRNKETIRNQHAGSSCELFEFVFPNLSRKFSPFSNCIVTNAFRWSRPDCTREREGNSCFYLSFILCCCLLFSTIVPSGSCSGLGRAIADDEWKNFWPRPRSSFMQRGQQQRILSQQCCEVLYNTNKLLLSFRKDLPVSGNCGEIGESCCIFFIPIFVSMKWDF